MYWDLKWNKKSWAHIATFTFSLQITASDIKTVNLSITLINRLNWKPVLLARCTSTYMYKLLDSVGSDFIGRMCLTSDPLMDDPAAAIDKFSYPACWWWRCPTSVDCTAVIDLVYIPQSLFHFDRQKRCLSEK